MLLVFLPALLFGDTFSMNIVLFKTTFWECLMLAGPGVLLGAHLTAAFAYYCLPYGWTWNFSMVFGSILAATDPVAVVALLKELGASPVTTQGRHI